MLNKYRDDDHNSFSHTSCSDSINFARVMYRSMGSMVCCSSLEGKYEESDIDKERPKPCNEELVVRMPNVTQQPALTRGISHQTLPPN
jgi:hypothetical protein